MGDPLEQVRAEAETWDEWGCCHLDHPGEIFDRDHPCPLPTPWVQPDATQPTLTGAWGDWVATVEPVAGIYLEWSWSLRFGEDVPLDAGTVDWLHDALAAAVDALPAGVAG